MTYALLLSTADASTDPELVGDERFPNAFAASGGAGVHRRANPDIRVFVMYLDPTGKWRECRSKRSAQEIILALHPVELSPVEHARASMENARVLMINAGTDLAKAKAKEADASVGYSNARSVFLTYRAALMKAERQQSITNRGAIAS